MTRILDMIAVRLSIMEPDPTAKSQCSMSTQELSLVLIALELGRIRHCLDDIEMWLEEDGLG